ncbi:MAG: zinc ribbon domain-containing protein [Vicinamibacterales bacterium]
MPLYEYQCLACGARVEALVRGDAEVTCPTCQSSNLQRITSLFAVSSEGTRQVNLAAGRKHQAKTSRDKKIADAEAMHHDHDH